MGVQTSGVITWAAVSSGEQAVTDIGEGKQDRDDHNKTMPSGSRSSRQNCIGQYRVLTLY